MSTITNGIILSVYCFIVILFYIVLSSPFNQIMTGFQNINITESDSHIESSVTLERIIFNIIFAGLMIIPVIWFIYMTFYREPNWRFR